MGQQCQKHPSRKTRTFGSTKISGDPAIWGYILCRILAPLRTLWVTRSIRDHFFLIRDMIRLRVFGFTLSAMRQKFTANGERLRQAPRHQISTLDDSKD